MFKNIIKINSQGCRISCAYRSNCDTRSRETRRYISWTRNIIISTFSCDVKR